MSRSHPIAVRLLALAALALALLVSQSATALAMICLPDAPREEVLSSPLLESSQQREEASWSFAAEKPIQDHGDRLPLRCDELGDVNCNWGIPEGEPRSPRPHQAKRTLTALAHTEAPPVPPAPNSLRSEFTATANSSEYLDDIFRPPRRS